MRRYARWFGPTVIAAIGLSSWMATAGTGSSAVLVQHVDTALSASPGPSNTAPGDQRYGGPLLRRGGDIRIAPAPSSEQPGTTQSQAYADFLATGMFPATARSYRADVRYGLFTDTEYGPIDSSGNVQPAYVNVPSWTVRFDNVPDELAGRNGPAGPGQQAGPPANAASGKADVLVVFNADTGAYMLAIDDDPMVAN